MKKIYILFIFSLAFGSSWSQLPNGSVAPDFTVTDVHGQSHHLYTYLEEGKTVFLDFFATWCGYCWNHHQGGAFEGLYDKYGPNGTNEIMVIMIEVDSRTNVNCLHGPSGCNYGTHGDWVTGTSYPVADDPALNNLYNISYFPTIYGICPNKILTEVGQQSENGYYSWYQSNCELKLDLVNIENAKCHESLDGEIQVEATGGTESYTYTWSNGDNGATAKNLAAGEYYCSVFDGGRTVVGGPYFVEDPEELVFSYFLTESPSCDNGNTGSVMFDIEGGTPNYQVLWNDGVEAYSRAGLEPGNYSITVEDKNGCSLYKEDINFVGIEIPVPGISSDTSVCEETIIEISVQEEGTYEWSTGESTQSIEIDVLNTETYYVTVTYPSGCVAEDSVYVDALELPIYGGVKEVMMNCQDNTLLIAPDDNEVPSFSYSWESLDGSDLSGINTNQYTLQVENPGVYQVTVIDNVTGCSGSSIVEVEPDENLPKIAYTVDGEITCINNEVEINANGSSQGSAFQFTWSSVGENHPIANANTLNPTITRPGTYNLTIINTDHDCDNSKNIEVGLGVVKAPDISIGYRINGSELQFYNASKFGSDHYNWYLPNGQMSSETEPIIDLNSIGDNMVTVCLETDNICGLTEMRCQTLDLLDNSHYFKGKIVDQFGDGLRNVDVDGNGDILTTGSSGVYNFTNLAFNGDVMVRPDIQNYQLNDVNEQDLAKLLSVLLGESSFDSEYIEYAADINEDGRLTTADLILMKQYLLYHTQEHNVSSWTVRDKQCVEGANKDFGLDCNPYIELKLLQSSHDNNDFVAIQKGDLSSVGNGNLFLGSRKNAGDIKDSKDGTWLVPLVSNKVLSVELENVGITDKILLNGQALNAEDMSREAGVLKIVKIFNNDRSHAELKIIERKADAVNLSSANLIDLEVFPNPVRDKAEVYFESTVNTLSGWKLFHGTSMKMVANGQQEMVSGLNNWGINTSQLSSGVYHLILNHQGNLISQKIVVQD